MIIYFNEKGAVANYNSLSIATKNTYILNTILSGLKYGDTFVVPSGANFYLIGGVIVASKSEFTFLLNGKLTFRDDRENWPTDQYGGLLSCIKFSSISNVLFTSSSAAQKGVLDGNGLSWWGYDNFLRYGENRPILFEINGGSNITFERILLLNSPRYHFFAKDVTSLTVHNAKVDARVDNSAVHDYANLQAFNTDGFDVSGSRAHFHDIDIWTQDDCIAVKDWSQHMLFERINCSGLGLAVGSIGNSIVNNITFRDCSMHSTVKGIYIKSAWIPGHRPTGTPYASISNITYENIKILSAVQYAIWIGPAQQNFYPCSLQWPNSGPCMISSYHNWNNIVLRNITIVNPPSVMGVILGNKSNPIKNLWFNRVVVMRTTSAELTYSYLSCQGVSGYASDSYPSPNCLVQSSVYRSFEEIQQPQSIAENYKVGWMHVWVSCVVVLCAAVCAMLMCFRARRLGGYKHVPVNPLNISKSEYTSENLDHGQLDSNKPPSAPEVEFE